ncbi:hypothetical protein [Candidatus Frankia nodulisporulans]|uniref:hypothetical protein n=1 Tax=Candidatus Frankia nodulisporulans TaxID=2060052 RepID=UPI001582D920|nr:hypothetical protein [Candidatus Frankia nodulisporulans]
MIPTPSRSLLGRPASSWTEHDRTQLAAEWLERLTTIGRIDEKVTIGEITPQADRHGTAIGYGFEAVLFAGVTWHRLRKLRAELAADLDATSALPVDVHIEAGSRPSRVRVTVHPALSSPPATPAGP